MKSLIVTCCIVLLATVSTQPANADIAKPKPPAEKPAPTPKYALHTSLEIVPDPKAYEAKLQITETELKEIHAALVAAGGNAPLAANITRSSTRTIIAGLLMFLSVSFAGVLFARSTSFGRRQKTVGAVVLIAAMLGAAAIITRGNAGPPGSYRWRNLPQALADGKAMGGGVDIEIVPDGTPMNENIRLIIPLKKQSKPGDEE